MTKKEALIKVIEKPEEGKILKESIKSVFNLEPNHPTDEELIEILLEFGFYIEEDINNDILTDIVFRKVKSKKMYKYEGLDNSDINNLINQIKKILNE